MMKILHINTYDTGGAAIGAIRIHNTLLSEGIDSNMLFYRSTKNIKNSQYVKTTHPPFVKRLMNKLGVGLTSFDNEIRKISRLGKTFAEGGTFELFSPINGPEQNVHLHKSVEEADIIHLHWISGFIDLPAFLKNLKKPIVWTLHDMNPFLGGFHYDIDAQRNPQFSNLENYYKNKKKQLLSNKKYAIIGNSKWTTNCAIASKQFENALSVETIYYPCNPSDFNIIDKTTAKTSLSLPNKTILGFACEDMKNPRKGFEILLRSLSLLTEQEKKDVCCLTFGKVNEEINRIENLNIIQLGTIDSPRIQSIIYSAMDFFIIPSSAEAFGQTCLEAMHCKTPVLGADVGGISEMVLDGETGFLFQKGSELDLLTTIRKAMRTSKLQREILANDAFKHVTKNHSPKQIAEQYINLYKLILA